MSTQDPGWGDYTPLPDEQAQPQDLPVVAPRPSRTGPGEPRPGGIARRVGELDLFGKNLEVTIAWVLTILTVGYFLPWAIAATRGKANSAAIGLIDLLLGWTIVGWVVALVMACLPHKMGAGMDVSVNDDGATGPFPGHASPELGPSPSEYFESWPAGQPSTPSKAVPPAPHG